MSEAIQRALGGAEEMIRYEGQEVRRRSVSDLLLAQAATGGGSPRIRFCQGSVSE